MRECFDMIAEFEPIQILQVFREGNKSADHVENLGVARDDEKWWWEGDSFPFKLCELVRGDAENLSPYDNFSHV